MTHNERCKECKKTVELMLKKTYGNVTPNYRIDIGTLPEDYSGRPFYKYLNAIYTSLQNHRGYHDFTRIRHLRMDYYLPDQQLIVKFDESQHFTEPRRKTFEHYPDSLKTGFSTKKWMKLCENLNKKDNDPPYRDEQRAWYDTLRDFLSETHGCLIIRLYARDMIWCSLDPENEEDVKRFKKMIDEKIVGEENDKCENRRNSIHSKIHSYSER